MEQIYVITIYSKIGIINRMSLSLFLISHINFERLSSPKTTYTQGIYRIKVSNFSILNKVYWTIEINKQSKSY